MVPGLIATEGTFLRRHSTDPAIVSRFRPQPLSLLLLRSGVSMATVSDA